VASEGNKRQGLAGVTQSGSERYSTHMVTKDPIIPNPDADSAVSPRLPFRASINRYPFGWQLS